jgi:hypothetical protein
MRPLRYSINISLDGCYDHQAMGPDEELHRHAAETLARADALLFGRVICGLMESAWRPIAQTGVLLQGIDEYEFIVHPGVVGHGPTLFAGLSKHVDLRLVGQKAFRSRAVALRYEPVRGA